MKIAVIGYSGAGKSTLAKKLGKLFRCPVLHLDRIQFEPGWKERDRETARRMAEDFLDENENRGWIIDGNYSGLCQERRLKEADLIRDTREGKYIYYELNASVLEEIMLWITDLKGESDYDGND